MNARFARLVCIGSFLTMVLPACRSTDGGSETKNVDSVFNDDDLPNLQCDQPGAIARYMRLAAAATKVKAADLGLSKSIKIQQPAVDRNVRLGLCVLDETVELKNVVVYTTDKAKAIIDVTSKAKIEGLYEMYYGQEYAGLNVLLPFETTSILGGARSPSVESLSIKGNEKLKGAYFATVYSDGSVDEGKDVIFGTFADTQGKVADPCPNGKQETGGSFTMGTAQIVWKGCTGGFSTSGTINTSKNMITITDSSPNLAPEYRNKAFTYDAEKPEDRKRLVSSSTHHNTCANFTLTFDQATYGFASDVVSTGWEDVCEKPVAGAPPRARDQDPGSVLYQFDYHGKIETGKKACPGGDWVHCTD